MFPSSLKFSLFAAAVLACYCGVLCTPVSFPDGQQSQSVPAYQKDGVAAAALVPDQSNITPPAPAAAEDDDEPTVGDIVDRVPQILDRIQNYINGAITSYTSNDTATDQAPPQLNQFLGLVDGFLSATNNFAQQFLQPAAGEEETGAGAAAAAEAPATSPVVENNV